MSSDVLDDARSFLTQCQTADGDNRTMAIDDLRFRAGQQWDDASVRQRTLDGRPFLTINNIPAIVHQVTNDIRQNRQSVHVHPVDDYGDEEVAEVIEGLIRHIEYDSGAEAAYDCAVESAVNVGFGYWRIVTEYCNPFSFEQDIKIKRIRNPFTVYFDPMAQEPDGSDAKRVMISTRMARSEFQRRYKGKASGDYLPKGPGDSEWLGPDFVRVAEFFRIEEKSETLTRLSDGSVRFASDKAPLPPGVFPTGDTRPTTVKKVMWYKVTASDVLESAELPFDWIPVFPVWGDEVDLDGKVIRSGLIRNAKDPKRMENFWMTAATEEIALRTKAPFIGAAGQFEGFEQDWEQANTRSFAYLEYNPVTIDGTQAPPPQRQPMADVPSGFIAMAGLARDNVKAVTGIYDASLGNRSNETSGIAISARQNQGELANFHFADNLRRTMRHMGRVILSAIPRIYDTPRVIRILGVDGKTPKLTPVNTPQMVQEEDENGEMLGAVEKVLNDLTVGRYDVVVETGPAYSTQREEAVANMLELGGRWPKLMDVAGDKVIRAMDWPGASDIADRIEKTLPPGIIDDDAQENMVQTPKGPIPAKEAGQMIGQLDHVIEQMSAELEKAQAGITKAAMEIASRERIAAMQVTAQHDAIELKGMIDMLMAKMDAMQVIQASEVQRSHDYAMAEMDHEREMERADQGAQHNAMQSAQEFEQQSSLPGPDDGATSSATEEGSQ